MPYAERKELYKKLETARNRPLIVYVTSSRQNATGQMGSDMIPEMIDQIMSIPETSKQVDVLVVSQGGDGTVAWRTMSLLRERFEKVSVLVPQVAFSAATLLAMGADEIVMHVNGNLGPVDPQINVSNKVKGDIRFGYEDLMGFLDFLKCEVGITEQSHIVEMMKRYVDDVGAVPIGIASRASLLTVTMGEQLLRLHMTGEVEAEKAKTIASALNKKFFHHGYAVSRSEARSIGLKIVDPEPEVSELMWQIWSDVESELEIRSPFNPLEVIANSGNANQVLGDFLTVNMPSNLPPQILQQAVQQILQQIQFQPTNPIPFTLVHAIVESDRLASRFVTEGKILATRLPDLNIKQNVVTTSQKWKMIEV